MNQEELQMVAFEIILNSGNARTLVHEAFASMRESDFEKAQQLLDESNEALVLAHQSQTGLLQQYANGVDVKMEVIMVHAQDHLMTTMTLREVALEMMHLYQKIN